MGKWTDKNYITHREWSTVFGGARVNSLRARGISDGTDFNKPVDNVKCDFTSLSRAPFDHCALSCLPIPAAHQALMDAYGNVFDEAVLRVYTLKYGFLHPFTLERMINDQSPELSFIKLQFFRNGAGVAWCPITLKPFIPLQTPMLVVRSTGRVYSEEGITCLAWKDFVDDTKIDKDKDVLYLQGPQKTSQLRKMFDTRLKIEEESRQSPIEHNIIRDREGAIGAVLQHLSQNKDKDDTAWPVPGTFIAKRSTLLDPTSTSLKASFSKGQVAASLTSSVMTPVLINESAPLSQDTALLSILRNNSNLTGLQTLVTIRTRLHGDLNCELFWTRQPKCCIEFLKMSKEGIYTDACWYRLIPGTYISARSNSVDVDTASFELWGEPMHHGLSHDQRGLISMMSTKKGHPHGAFQSNFLITLFDNDNDSRGDDKDGREIVDSSVRGALDSLHTVFGKVLLGDGTSDRTLTLLESSMVQDEGSKLPASMMPMIEDIIVVSDEPIVRAQRMLQDKLGKRDGHNRISSNTQVVSITTPAILSSKRHTPPSLIGKYMNKSKKT